eukprot:7344691-Pyramimonas_sp.AAC.2
MSSRLCATSPADFQMADVRAVCLVRGPEICGRVTGLQTQSGQAGFFGALATSAACTLAASSSTPTASLAS